MRLNEPSGFGNGARLARGPGNSTRPGLSTRPELSTWPGLSTWLLAAGLSCALFLVYAVWGASAGPSEAHRADLFEFPLDDAWIHQVYVRGLLREGLPTYNPGAPEAGFSSPLWLAISLPFHAVARVYGWNLVILIKLASLLCALLTAVGLAAVSHSWVDARHKESCARLTAAFVLLSPGFCFSAVSGMEVCAAAAALAWALAFWLRQHWRSSAWLSALAALARPEALVVVVGLAAVTGLQRKDPQKSPQADSQARLESDLRGHARARGGAILNFVAPTVALFALWAGYCWAVTGQPLPNTVLVKLAASARPLSERFAYLFSHVIFDSGVAVGALGLLGCALAAVALARTPNGRNRVLAFVVAIPLPLLAIVVAHPVGAPVLFYSQRYLYPFSIQAMALVAPGVFLLVRFVIKRIRTGRVAAGKPDLSGRGMVLLVGLLLLLVTIPGHVFARQRYAAHCRDIDQLHTHPAQDVRTLSKPDAVVAVEGAGRIAFSSQRHTFDLLGLNNAAVAQAPDAETRNCLVAAARPAWMVVPEMWLGGLRAGFELDVVKRYTSPQWSVVDGLMARTVVLARASVRPVVEARCAAAGALHTAP